MSNITFVIIHVNAPLYCNSMLVIKNYSTKPKHTDSNKHNNKGTHVLSTTLLFSIYFFIPDMLIII